MPCDFSELDRKCRRTVENIDAGRGALSEEYGFTSDAARCRLLDLLPRFGIHGEIGSTS